MWIELVSVLREMMDIFSVGVYELTVPFLPEDPEEELPVPWHGSRPLELMLSAAIERMLYGEVLVLDAGEGTRCAAFLHPDRPDTLILVGPWSDRTCYPKAFQRVLLRLIGLFFPEHELSFTYLDEDLTKTELQGLA